MAPRTPRVPYCDGAVREQLNPYVRLDGGDTDDALSIDSVRTDLNQKGDMVVGAVCRAALEHAAQAVTHTDETIVKAYRKLRSLEKDKVAATSRNFFSSVKGWVNENRVKTFLMLVGLGGTAFKAHTISMLIRNKAQKFIDWSTSTTPICRFGGFVVLMTVRLVISTLVPPTSPAFGIIIQAATPEDEKWTAMPFFLLASTIAGAFPYVMDKVLQICFREDFKFTMFMKHFAEVWPLTCWTEPVMRQVFTGSGGGKTGATLAIIFAHAAPFMGAQTTCLQRFFLPHPLDTIVSQPFGMSEDLISMAMAEAKTNPLLASVSLTVIICSFNFCQYYVFTHRTDGSALAIGLLNMMVGVLVACDLARGVPMPFVMVGVQLMAQMFLVPLIVLVASKLCPSRIPPRSESSSSGATLKRDASSTLGELPRFSEPGVKFASDRESVSTTASSKRGNSVVSIYDSNDTDAITSQNSPNLGGS